MINPLHGTFNLCSVSRILRLNIEKRYEQVNKQIDTLT